MKTFILAFFCITAISMSNAQVTNMIGTWNIIEFATITDENSEKMTEDKLKEDGSVWDLIFNEEGKIKQTSNMRTGSIESQEGTWDIAEDTLSLIFQMNDRKIELNYTYELKENILVLMRNNPMGTLKIVSKFRKK